MDYGDDEIISEKYTHGEYWKVQTQLDLPYLPTSISVIQEIFAYINQNFPLKHRSIVDLGAGDGRVLFHVAEIYHAKATGYEINHDFVKIVRTEIKKRSLQSQVRICEKDFYEITLEEYDVVFCFFLPTMYRYVSHILKTIHSDAYVISVKWSLDQFTALWKTRKEMNFDNNLNCWIYTTN